MNILSWLCLQAEDLKENVFYQFQVRAMNIAGVSETSLPSAALECREWTITVPGVQGDSDHKQLQ